MWVQSHGTRHSSERLKLATAWSLRPLQCRPLHQRPLHQLWSLRRLPPRPRPQGLVALAPSTEQRAGRHHLRFLQVRALALPSRLHLRSRQERLRQHQLQHQLRRRRNPRRRKRVQLLQRLSQRSLMSDRSRTAAQRRRRSRCQSRARQSRPRLGRRGCRAGSGT